MQSPAPIMPEPVTFPVTPEHEAWQRRRVIECALTWVGTPYRQCGAVKGPKGAVDCSMLLVMAWIEAGVFKPFDPRPYSPVWFLHRSEERYLGWLDKIGQRTNAPVPGDVITYQFGRCVSHSAILVDDKTIVHAFANERRCITSLRDFQQLKARERVSFDMWARLRAPK